MEENIPDVLSDQIDDPNLPDGGSIGSLDCANVDYDDPHLYRPHAFALRHGDDGAQIAYGELHWRVDTITLQFQKKTVAVDPHPDHSHAPHANHSHSDHTDHSHADHTDHEHSTPAHTHTGTTDNANPINTGSDQSDGTGSYAPTSHLHSHSHTHTFTTNSNTADHTGGVVSTTSSGSSSVSAEDGVLGHSGVTTTSHGTPASDSGILDHSNAVNTDGSALGTDSAGVLKHSGVKDVSDGTSTAPTEVLNHTVTGLEGAGNVITYCDGAGQSAINNITQQVPNINEKDGEAMNSKLDGVHTFHQLDGYGEVYLCWEVDFEESPNVQKCWVQIGVPVGSVTGPVSIGNDTTGRLTDPPDEFAVSTYHVHIGTVNLNERVVQKISSDVSWQPIVMDRVRV
tara:strand:- start:386 stop:1579 length:1194 start_codon:yes stop_codon:yes gene_type:complete